MLYLENKRIRAITEKERKKGEKETEQQSEKCTRLRFLCENCKLGQIMPPPPPRPNIGDRKDFLNDKGFFVIQFTSVRIEYTYIFPRI